MEPHRTLYKRGSKGEVRIWYMERDVDKHRVVSGVLGGAETRTGWTVCSSKNVGKANETSPEEQAESEIMATYRKKLDRGYFEDVTKIDEVPFTKPMLAHKWEDYAHVLDYSSGVFVQPKLDGIRCIVRSDGMWTRTGQKMSPHVTEHIWDSISPVFDTFPDMIFDGELYNHDLRDDFNTISSLVRTKKGIDQTKLTAARTLIQYHVYDIVGEEVFGDRHGLLTDILHDLRGTPIKGVHTLRVANQAEVRFYEEQFLSREYEGLIARANTPYENKRSKNLLKFVQFQSDEFDVVEVLEGEGNWRGYAKHFTIRQKDGRTCGAGVRGTQETLATLLTKDKPDWATVRYRGLTPDGKLRFPVVTDWGYGERND